MYLYTYSALIVAGSVFSIVACMHLLRLIYHFPVIIGKKSIPLWASGLGLIISSLLALWMFLASCKVTYASNNRTFQLQSSVFKQQGTIPLQYTCQGDNLSPPLNWHGAPVKTRSFALIMDDPDANSGNWTHWILYNLPAKTQELSKNVLNLPKGTRIAKNSWGKTTYGGPCPPTGEHRYYFKLFALDSLLNSSIQDKSQLEAAMQGHIIGKAELMGTYKNKNEY